MALLIGIDDERHAPGEKRVAATPDTIKKLQTLKLGCVVAQGAGEGALIDLAAWQQVGAQVVARAEMYAQADIIFCVSPPQVADIARAKPGAVWLGLLQPYDGNHSAARIAAWNAKQMTSFAIELLPRISRAQNMDVLSSQAACSGYQCVLMAAQHAPKFFPMTTYAAGSLRPARVLVIGAGVAGLQAIATAKRLGAVVEGYDVRPETKEQIESLGAKFVDTGLQAAGSGGYARELSAEEQQQQAQKLTQALAQMDVVITTAAIPGKKAPQIITEQMVQQMKHGAVVVDMAAETGGNCAFSQAGQTVYKTFGDKRITIIGAAALPSQMAVHASEMIAKNLLNFITPHIKEGQWQPDWEDEIVRGTLLTKAGQLQNSRVAQVLGL